MGKIEFSENGVTVEGLITLRKGSSIEVAITSPYQNLSDDREVARIMEDFIFFRPQRMNPPCGPDTRPIARRTAGRIAPIQPTGLPPFAAPGHADGHHRATP